MSRILITLTVLFWQILPFTPVFASATPSLTPTSGQGCNLPAPSNFRVTSISTTYVNLAWDSVPGANGYSVVTYNAAGLQVNSQNVAGTTATVSGLEAGTPYYSVVSPICGHSSLGDAAPGAARVDYITLIVELILQASGPGMIVVEYPASCTELPWDASNNAYWYEITEISTGRTAMYEVRFDGYATIENRGPIPGGTLATAQVNEKGFAPFTTGEHVVVQLVEEADLFKVTFEMNWLQQTIKICEQNITAGYTFRLIAISHPDGFPTGNRSTEGKKTTPPGTDAVLKAQNPFAETLSVFTEKPLASPAHIRLFHLNGRLALEKQYEAGQENDLLQVPDLPAGLYFLQIETAGKVETLKIVKSKQ